MKKYYQTLKKEDKQKIKKEYQKEYQNTELQTRFTRLNIYIILAFYVICSYLCKIHNFINTCYILLMLQKKK